MEKLAVLYLLLINAVTFVTYGVDKWKARHYHWRIPEATLLLLAAMGGSVGALLGIWLLRHKTQHPQFTWGVPGILVIQLTLLWLCSCTPAQAAPQRLGHAAPLPSEHSPSTLIVMCDSAIGKQPLRDAVQRLGGAIVYDYKLMCGMAIGKPETMSLEATRDSLLRVQGVLAVEYDRIVRLTDSVRPRIADR